MSASRTPTLSEVFQSALQTLSTDLHVALPGKILSYDAGQQTVDVQPQIQTQQENPDGTLVSVRIPVLTNVPVCFPGAGGFRITFPVEAGDTCLVVFTDGSLDRWLSDGVETDVSDARQHSLADAVAVLGLNPFNKTWAGASTINMTLGKDGGPQIEMRPATIGLNAGLVESVVLGTTYRTLEDQMFLAIQTFMTSVSALLSTPDIISSTAQYTAAKAIIDAAQAAGQLLSTVVKVA